MEKVQVSLYAGESCILLEAEAGIRVSELLKTVGRPLALPCAGNGRCGKCRVRAAGQLDAPGIEEKGLLSEEELAMGIRLACQVRLAGEAEIWLSGIREDADIQVGGAGRAYSRDPVASGCGAAVDIGTTTVAAVLVDLDTGAELASACDQNPQGAFGADVISRMERALAGDGPGLARAIGGCIEGLLETLCREAGKDAGDISALFLTGNTTMLYLLTGREVDCLSHAPFKADERFGSKAELSFAGAPRAECYLVRCNSAFVGGDITSAVVASGMAERPETTLLIDVGTNGEIVLSHKGRLYGASTAAGPALEGAGIHMGMPAVSGAIRRVAFDGNIQVETVGGEPDRGICGSGVIDAMAALLRAGVVDETGFLLEEGHPFEDRICQVGESLAFRIGMQTVFTQKDIRAVQLAKAAICAGICTLLKEAGLEPGQVDRFAIAGGFGSHIDVASARVIGLFPPELAEKAEVLGNAALKGTEMLLQSKKLLKASAELADRMETVDLSANPFFSGRYMESMMFELE